METKKVDDKYVAESLNEYYSQQPINEPLSSNVATQEIQGLTFFVGNMTTEEFKRKMKSMDFEDFTWI